MWFGTHCLLRGLWYVWRLGLECERSERINLALVDARAELGELASSIWLIRKADLVRLAMGELGWSCTTATETAVDHLRDVLWYHRVEALLGAGTSPSTGLSRMNPAAATAIATATATATVPEP